MINIIFIIIIIIIIIIIALIPIKPLAYEGGHLFNNVGNPLGNKIYRLYRDLPICTRYQLRTTLSLRVAKGSYYSSPIPN